MEKLFKLLFTKGSLCEIKEKKLIKSKFEILTYSIKILINMIIRCKNFLLCEVIKIIVKTWIYKINSSRL